MIGKIMENRFNKITSQMNSFVVSEYSLLRGNLKKAEIIYV